MNAPVAPPDGERIVDEALTDALSRRYLAYALSTITQRALPDVRDGLKPVHRRLLYAMRLLRLDPASAAKKCARVVGDVIGRFHPHGDQSVYDALVRLAQDFAQRYPLVDGQGNFGNIDGDNAAAMRYTECRLTPAGQLLLEGIDEDAVDFRATYNDEDEEPIVLPAAFPHLLANGSSGIAVGMATSIPPHNAAELIDACLHLLERPDASTADLMAFVPGPDLPTGGVIVEPAAALLEGYETGRGGVRVRARWEKEESGRGLYQIVVTEIPYQVKKSDLVEQLAGLIEAKKAPLLEDVRDESAEDIRLVLVPKSRNVEAEVLMESLFGQSALEARLSVNMNVLDARGAPGVLGLKALLKAFLDHRRETIVRRARHRLGKIEQRLEVLAGMLIVFLNLDEVIRIVRYEEEPRARLIETFELTEAQADAILNTRLRQLAKLEEMELRREHDELTRESAGISALLGSDARQWKLVAAGLKDVRKVFAPETALGRRRSTIAEAPRVDLQSAVQALVQREPMTVVLSERGWIRAVRGRVADASELKFKEGDSLAFLTPTDSASKLLLFTSDGRFFTLPVDRLPPGRGAGEPVRLLMDLEDEVDILAVLPHQPGGSLIVASKAGYGFRLSADDALGAKRGGRQVLNVGGEGAALCVPVTGDSCATLGDNGKALIFALDELPEMTRGKGVRLQGFREGGLADLMTFDSETGPSWLDAAGRQRSWQNWADWRGRRAASGRLVPRGFPTSRRFGWR